MSEQVVWEEADNANPVCVENGITSIAVRRWSIGTHTRVEYHGYNGMVKGDKVTYNGREYTIVMVSRLGHFGLSETGALPYTERVSANEVAPAKED